ncbi:MAG: hypothetical protein GT589_09965 [Peptoclostridium sp.]|uniref:AarF/UbiB family protein n=1 Tax=Peptoclostridium sp. TaxID=1904860 RepID=UPI00139E0412|nr:AarF/ABC1/UbiB kinase family protein [Peptoclostridium sp.]MZQ76460.1 hypothetical protein [Peptoclostridium sp.]
MNWVGFVRLIKSIYGEKLPDLEWIEKQGLLAVKIGQTFALRIDFLNERTCAHLSRLYSSNTNIPPEKITSLIEYYSPEGWRDNFEYIEEKPLASASVGQVHRARLKTGEEVVVKLVKKDFKKSFKKDVESLKSFLKTAIFFYPKLDKVADPLGILKNIEKYTLDELNLLNEIAHRDILEGIKSDNMARHDLSRLKFPKVYKELSNENILVSEFIEGETFDKLLSEGRLDYENLLELFHIHGFYVFNVGTFHGDIHPGNIILKGNDMYFVDTGALGLVGTKIKKGLFRFMENLSFYNYDECARSLNEMADVEISGEKYDDYREKFMKLYADFTGKSVSQVSLTRKMMDTIKLGVNSGMVFEKGMYPIIKSLMYLDGMVLKCNPNAVLMEDMRQFIGELKGQED